jgi:hypothetical protein
MERGMLDLADRIYQIISEENPTPKDLEATGDCYYDAGKFVMRNPGWVLVHGRPTLRRPPFVEFGHAWAEKGDQVFDPSSGFRGPRYLYYSLGNIDYRENLVYSNATLMDFLRLAKHWGPWEGPDGTPPDTRKVREWKAAGRKLPKSKKAKKPKTPYADVDKLFQRDT